MCVHCGFFSDVEPEALNLQAESLSPQKSIGTFSKVITPIDFVCARSIRESRFNMKVKGWYLIGKPSFSERQGNSFWYSREDLKDCFL